MPFSTFPVYQGPAGLSTLVCQFAHKKGGEKYRSGRRRISLRQADPGRRTTCSVATLRWRCWYMAGQHGDLLGPDVIQRIQVVDEHGVVICSITVNGLVSPPVQKVSQSTSILFFSSPLIIAVPPFVVCKFEQIIAQTGVKGKTKVRSKRRCIQKLFCCRQRMITGEHS